MKTMPQRGNETVFCVDFAEQTYEARNYAGK